MSPRFPCLSRDTRTRTHATPLIMFRLLDVQRGSDFLQVIIILLSKPTPCWPSLSAACLHVSSCGSLIRPKLRMASQQSQTTQKNASTFFMPFGEKSCGSPEECRLPQKTRVEVCLYLLCTAPPCNTRCRTHEHARCLSREWAGDAGEELFINRISERAAPENKKRSTSKTGY